MSSVLTRFAPSPTGYLHIGNARAALFCWLFARQAGGRFMLRIDDTDKERSRPEYTKAICEDLHWLGLTHDDYAEQATRFGDYDAAFEDLRARGLVYPCFETQAELERKRKRQRARGQPPIYDRAALDLSSDEIKRLEAERGAPHYRFKLSGARVEWEDLVRGAQSIDTASVSDPVLRRADGTYLYTLPSVVDDMAFGVSHIIRGEDHVTNTAAQIELTHALGGTIPIFGHFSLLLSAEGGGLSKRGGALSLGELRGQGIEAMAINSLLARLGTADAVVPTHDMDALVAGFDIARLGRAAAKFDPQDLHRLTAKILHAMPYAKINTRLQAEGIEISQDVWEALRANLEILEELRGLLDVVAGEVTPVIDDADTDYLAQALEALPDGAWDDASWGQWTQRLAEASGRKGRALFLPLRRALTGRDHGPEMHHLLPHMDREKVQKRLRGIRA